MTGSGKIQISARWAVSGSSLMCLQVDPGSTLDSLRRSIERACCRAGCANFHMKMLMNGEALEGSQTLADACVNDGALLDVVLQQVRRSQDSRCRGQVACIGASAVGKSALLAQFTGAPYNGTSGEPTIGIDFSSKVVQIEEQRAVRLQIWEISSCTAGTSLVQLYIKDVDVAIVVYDITRRDSFDEARHHLKYARNLMGGGKPLWLIGNKADCTEVREVAGEEGQAMAKECHAFFAEASASTGHGVSTIFHHLAEEIQDANDRSNQSSNKKSMNWQSTGLSCANEHDGIQPVQGETQDHLSKKLCKQVATYVRLGLGVVRARVHAIETNSGKGLLQAAAVAE